ncbi:protein sidekick-1-like [Montipora capricornis]|uniref:protein sidekick-1-like n=1 Tax=Montipora capricornis TaxID=246305 RepID=UPI0035F188F1
MRRPENKVIWRMDQKIVALIALSSILAISQYTNSLWIPARTDLKVSNRTSSSLTIDWSPVNARVVGYRVRYRRNDTSPRVSVNSNCTPAINVTAGQQFCMKHSMNYSSIFVCNNKTTVRLKNLTLYTFYWIEVTAFTNTSFANKSFNITSHTDEGKPSSPPVNITAYVHNSTTISVAWLPVPKEHRNGRIILYNVVMNAGNSCNKSNDFPVADGKEDDGQNVTVPKLCKYTEYTITVLAKTSKGPSISSTGLSVKTAEGAPDKAPTNLTVIKVTADSIQISWQPVPQESLNGKLRGYMLRWKDVKAESYTYQELLIKGPSARRKKRAVDYLDPPPTNFTLRDLTVYTNYSVEIAAHTGAEEGLGPYSQAYFMSGEGVPTYPPRNVTAYNTSESEIRVEWTPPVQEKIHGVLAGFDVTFTASHNASSTHHMMICGSKRAVNLSNLAVFTFYNITVAAFTQVGIGNTSDMIQTRTDESIPSPPVNVRTRSWSLSSVRVSWDEVPVDDRNGYITGYIVELRNGSGLIRNRTVDGENNRTAVLDGLEMFVTYNISVRAKTKAGPGGPSSPVNATTNQTIPDVNLTFLYANATSNSSITVLWQIQHINKRLNEPTRYRLSYCPKKYCEKYSFVANHNAKTSAYPVNLNTLFEYSLRNLTTYVEYKIRVRAVGITAKDGTKVLIPRGNFSEPIYKRTLEGVPGAAPSNVSATPESTTSILVRWGELPWDKVNANITEYIIKLYNGSTLEYIRSYNVSSHDFSFSINPLEVYSNYSVQVQAVAKTGSGPFSEFVNTTTHQPAPTVVPQNVEAVATGTTTILVTWTPLERRSIVGFQLQGYDIKYTNSVLGEHERTQNVDDVAKFTLTNLKIFAEYKIQVAARSTQPGNFSSPKTVRTHEGVPSKPPEIAEPVVLDSISVRLRWSPIPNEFHNGIIRGYRISYERLVNSTKQEKTTVPPARTVMLLNLDKATKYHGEILAYTNAGDGKEANFTFKTADDIPSQPPVELKPVNRISPTKLNVTWKPVPEQFRHGTLTNYIVTYQRVKVGDVRQKKKT